MASLSFCLFAYSTTIDDIFDAMLASISAFKHAMEVLVCCIFGVAVFFSVLLGGLV